jgi:hypothetical protein
MSKVTNIDRARVKKHQAGSRSAPRQAGFLPCSPDMTICGDCADNRSKNKCPRLKEWLARQGEG